MRHYCGFVGLSGTFASLFCKRPIPPDDHLQAELQKPRQRVSNADRKVFANSEGSLLAEEFLDTLQYKISR